MTNAEKLMELQKKLCRSTSNKFKNNDNYTELFSFENLILVSNELICIIVNKIENNQLDEKGMYNYFRKAFSYKCQDLYRGSKRKKRDFSLINKDIHEIADLIENNNPSTEQITIKKELINDISKKIEILEKTLLNKYPLLLIFNLIKDGYSYEEISKKTNLSERILKGIKNKIILFLTKEYQNEYPFDFSDNSSIIYIEPKFNPVQNITFSIETNYKFPNNFAKIQLCKQEDDKKIIIEEFVCKNKNHYNENYNYLKKKLIELN